MSYQHFSTFERGRIEELLTLGYSNRAIATRLNRHRSSIDRELQRNTGGSPEESYPITWWKLLQRN